ncbi:MAG: ATP synthase F1 subunit gamma [Lachnospiraceae bacterium]|nr:ATP synthase F1 subunit gamma [Lachnospiraceae bacterium]MCR5476755.1 ATP synthase F1 subunit gamma [Lachnospiraceae bacterium]
MAGMREIAGRIRSVRDTMKITNAMYMISSTKLRKARKEMDANTPYFTSLQKMLVSIMMSSAEHRHMYLDTRRKKTGKDRVHAVIVITADKGLAGPYNHNVVRLVEERFLSEENREKETVKLYVVGEVGRQYFASKKVHMEGQFRYTAQNPSLHRARVIMETVLEEFRQKRVDDVSIVYTEMKGLAGCEAKVMHLLPLLEREVRERLRRGDLPPQEELHFVPSADEVLTNIVPDVLVGYIYSALVDSYCSEQNERMTAMDAANRNASEMIHSLKIQYNRERQARITQEITEVASGAKKVKKDREESEK